MDSVLIPDIYRLMSGPYHSIDNFTTLCEELEDHIDPIIDEVRMEKMISIMKRLRDYKPNEVFPQMNELFYLLTETVFSVVESQENWSLSESTKPSVARIIRDKVQKMIVGGRILPHQTLTEKKCHERYKQVREYKEVQDLKKLIEEHKEVYQELQKQQKKCWIINDKVTEAADKLTDQRIYFVRKSDTFSLQTGRLRRDFINFLQEKFERKMEKAAETVGKYQTLLHDESVSKDKVRQLESHILDSLKFGFTEKISSGLSSLKRVLSTSTVVLSTSTSERSHGIMQHIQKLETESQNFVTNIIHTLSSKYSFVLPQEFHLQHEFSEKIPDCKITKCQENIKQIKSETGAKIEKGEHQCISSDKANSDEATFAYVFTRRTYLHPRDLNIKTGLGFSAVPKGMIVKQRIATASTGVTFGWYKMQPWQQKKWAFFLKNSNTTLA